MPRIWVPDSARRDAEEKVASDLLRLLERAHPGVFKTVKWATAQNTVRVLIVAKVNAQVEVAFTFAELDALKDPEREVAFIWQRVHDAASNLAVQVHNAAPPMGKLTEYVIGYREWHLLLDPDVPVELPDRTRQPWPEELDVGESVEDMLAARAGRKIEAQEAAVRAAKGVTFDQRNFRLTPIGITKATVNWDGGNEVEAACNYGRHPAPAPDGCHCGWNAWHEPRFNGIARTIKEQQRKIGLTSMVWGVVRCWGRMEVHGDGIRAQFAQPVALAYSAQNPEHGRYVRDAAAKFGIAAVPEADLVSFGEEFGKPVPEDLRLPRLAPSGGSRVGGGAFESKGLWQMAPSNHLKGAALDFSDPTKNMRAAVALMQRVGLSATSARSSLGKFTGLTS